MDKDARVVRWAESRSAMCPFLRDAMKKAPLTVYRDELLAPPPGEWCLELVLGEDDVEKLMTGRVSREVMETAFRALSWKRGDQAWEHYICPCPRCVAQRER